jgi:hypothetical protein
VPCRFLLPVGWWATNPSVGETDMVFSLVRPAGRTHLEVKVLYGP